MIRFFTRHRTAANLLMIMIFILGTMSTLAMIRETLPEFAPEKVMVQVIYKGASPREVEDSICTLVEEKLEGIDGIERVSSKASEGIGQITLEMKEGYDLSRFYQDIKNEIDQINSFPEDAETPLVFIVKKKDPVITLAVTGDLPFRHLKEFGKDLRKKLLKNPAISLVDLEGVSQIQVKIKIKENTLRSLGLSLPLVRETILKQSKNLPLGTIENRDREILIRMMDQRTTPQAFGNLVIFSAEKGAQIRLSDIAEIKWDLEKREDAVFLNGKKAVTLAIQKSPGEDALVIEREVKKFAREQNKFLPKGMELHTIENVAAVVQDRLTLLIKNAFQGFILVFFTLWLFLNIRIERALLEVNRELTPLQPGKRPLVKCVEIRLGANGDAAETGSHAVTISAELLTSELRTCTSDDLVLLWRKKLQSLPDVISLKFGEPVVGPAGKAFDVEFKNSDLSMLSKASREFRQKLGSYIGVYNISDNLNPGKWEARITTLPQAKNFGFTSRDISNQLSASFFGAKAQDFQLGSENIEVRVQFSDRDRNSLKNLEDFHLIDPKGKEVPLSHVARIRLERSYSNIYHVEGQRTVTITADVDMKRANASAILGALKKDYLPSLLKKYPALEVDYSGQPRETAKTIPSARKGFILGLVGIFVILSFVFGSYIQPITIMVAIPFGLVGAVFGHYFMGLSMSMPSIVGFVSLSGIVVNDSIVLIEFMNNHMKSGMSPPEAAVQASIARFRPVFLTSATTIAGLLPLLLEKSFQAQILIPLATSVSFGLIFSTILVLLFIPCLTAIFYDFGLLKEGKPVQK